MYSILEYSIQMK